ncbi:putative photosystem I [Helianthus anomalus]
MLLNILYNNENNEPYPQNHLLCGAHFVWAFSLMFLFSGRGYWQELIESIVWAHNKLKVAPGTHPRALSIVQGRETVEKRKKTSI